MISVTGDGQRCNLKTSDFHKLMEFLNHLKNPINCQLSPKPQLFSAAILREFNSTSVVKNNFISPVPPQQMHSIILLSNFVSLSGSVTEFT